MEEIVMSLNEILREKRQEILAIAAKHGAYNVRIFGSVARGEADEDSDVDFLIDAGPKRTPFFPGGLVRDLEGLLGRPVDVVTEKGLRSRIRERVLKEAVPL
jgi:predicted nucleotidyltransferase